MKVLNSRPKRAGFGADVPNTMLKYNYSFVFSDDINEWMGCDKRQRLIAREVTRRRVARVIKNRAV